MRVYIAFFQELSPLIRAGIVHSLPIEVLHRPPQEIAIDFSPDWYRSQVPDVIHDFVHKNVVIHEMQPYKNGKGLVVVPRPPTQPVRGIMISFANDDPVTGTRFYLLFETETIKAPGDGSFSIKQTLPWDKVPEKEQFKYWVYQSINKTISSRLKEIASEMALAEALNAVYLTESEFEATLCGKLGIVGNHSNTVDAVNFLRANEPRLTIGNATQILAIRESNPRLFMRFHETLLNVSSSLHGSSDFASKAQRLLESEIIPQIEEIETAGKKVLYNLAGGVITAGTTIGLACVTGATLPMAAVLGCAALMTAGTALPAIPEYLRDRKRPAYIWRKIIKS